MYKSFYGLSTSPFQINTDPTFLWLGENHREAISMLKYGIQNESHTGLLLLTGNAGTGKTTLINALFKILDRNIIRVAIINPNLEGLDFLNYIAASFGSKKNFSTKSSFLIAFEKFLNNARNKGRKVLLVIDEAQLLNYELLEEIRLLSNFEKDGESLIRTFLVGQQELREKLNQPKNNALTQRITLNYHIDALVSEETDEYIRYRLQVAGRSERIFNPESVKMIHQYAQGLPRQINIICDHALLAGYVQNLKQIHASVIRECVKEFSIVQVPVSSAEAAQAGPGSVHQPPHLPGHDPSATPPLRAPQSSNDPNDDSGLDPGTPDFHPADIGMFRARSQDPQSHMVSNKGKKFNVKLNPIYLAVLMLIFLTGSVAYYLFF